MKRIIGISLLAVSLLCNTTGYSQTWKEQADKLCKTPKKSTVVLLSKIKVADKKKELKGFPIEESFPAIFMCDFLANVMFTSEEIPVSSFSAFAISKFPFGKEGGMAYIIESRFFDFKTNNSEIVMHYLVTVSAQGEILYPFILGLGGTYLFPNGEYGACTSSDQANAMHLKWESNYVINNDFTFICQKEFTTHDVVIDTQHKIIKTFPKSEEGAKEPVGKIKVWIDDSGEIKYEDIQ
jgi:hypothetical protein